MILKKRNPINQKNRGICALNYFSVIQKHIQTEQSFYISYQFEGRYNSNLHFTKNKKKKNFKILPTEINEERIHFNVNFN